MAGSWTEDKAFMEQFSDSILRSMSAYPRKLIHTDELIHAHDMTFSEIQLLTLLSMRSVTIEEASRTLNIAKTNLAILTRSLIDKGYMERITDTKDKRKAFLAITPLGREEYAAIRDSIASQLKRLSVRFSKVEIRTMIKAVDQINDVLDEI